ncbi:MAG: protein-methionine-sulfoxide reductase heme-binding subunit MsrQ [Pseudomonadota bacterium]
MLRDRVNQGIRLTPTWVIYGVGLVPGIAIFYLALTGGLGVDPVKRLEHELGEFALRLVVFGLAITPLFKFLRINLIKFRRAIGILAFIYVTLHLLVWLVLDVQILSQIWADILKRPYITIGMAAFLLMVPLAATSNNISVRKLGPRWKRLHQATYAVAILGAVHFIMLTKGFQLEPVIYLCLVVVLLALRLVPHRKPASVV